MKKELHIRVEEDLHAELAAEAQRLGVSINTVVLLALSEWRTQKEASDGTQA